MALRRLISQYSRALSAEGAPEPILHV